MPNEVTNYDGFYVSYTDGRETNPFDALGVMLGFIKQDNLGRPETALVVPDEAELLGSRFLILYGDYRAAYAAIANQGLHACIELFEKHLEHITDTSDLPIRSGLIN